MTSEMILTCLSSFAQAESESISGNVTKGIRMGYRQGRFAFRYTGFAYRKGADGQPEIIPEDAETILLIAQNFLAGDSLKVIKEKLEARGLLSPGGEPVWSTQAILRILRSEKYAGDVLLQKTYTANFLEGIVRKNDGVLPQYYIQNNHPAIIPREMYLQIQEELARRNSKKPANVKKSKTNRGRFTSKYALSERLVCGECGSYFRRVTWNIHGRKEIVWRCINRLEFGPSACGKSPSLIEESLHRAILEAIRSLVNGRQEEMAESLRETLADCLARETDGESPQAIQNQIEELEQEFDRLLPMAAEENEVTDRRLKQINDEILQLKQRKKRAEHSHEWAQAREAQASAIMNMVSAADLNLTEYSDVLVYRIVERVTVLSKEEIRIRFIGGLEISQPLV